MKTPICLLSDGAHPIIKLAGMGYHSGSYNADEWFEKTGVDARLYPNLIHITRGGLCVWSERAEAIYQKWINTVKIVQNQLGIN